jgi:exodeoxyribonuclease V beta subunit
LGTTPSCYGPAALAEAMAEHHYVLQYHLYTLAWVRHLQHALPGFDYARDFGGVLYLFLRGMSPEHPGSGIYSECPPPGRLDALSDLFTLRAGASATETT